MLIPNPLPRQPLPGATSPILVDREAGCPLYRPSRILVLTQPNLGELQMHLIEHLQQHWAGRSDLPTQRVRGIALLVLLDFFLFGSRLVFSKGSFAPVRSFNCCNCYGLFTLLGFGTRIPLSAHSTYSCCLIPAWTDSISGYYRLTSI